MKKKNPMISIVIPLFVIQDRFFSDLHTFYNQTYPEFEIIIVSDKKISPPKNAKLRVLYTHKHKTGPAEKRDLAMTIAKGDIIAFIDDDAYPEIHWLEHAVKHFQNNPEIVGVGGPGITPKEDPFLSQLGGLVYESKVTSGKAQHRFISDHQHIQFTNDWPAYNLFVRKDILLKINGYNCTFYGGEDTFLCLKLISYGNILYDPSVIVYHHRRPLFTSHLKQIFNVGVHRGYFFKKFPETSRQLFYTLPSLLTAGCFAFGITAFIVRPLLPFFLASLSFFFLLACSTVMRKTNLIGTVLTGAGILLTHISYGLGFIYGLLTKSLAR